MPPSIWTPQKPIRNQVRDQMALIQDVKAVYNVDLGLTDITLALKEYIAQKEKGRKGREPVAIGFPFVGMLTAAFFIGFCRLRQSPQDYMIPVIDTTLLSAARNKCVETFLASNYNWLLFLDSDVTPPSDGIDRLMAHGKKIVSGLYHQKGGEFLPNMYRYKYFDAEKGLHEYDWIAEWPKDETIAVDGVGAGFLLIHREVFDAIGTRDWFNFKEGGEDLAFCRQAKDRGYDIWVDTSVRCGHVSYMVVGTDHYYARQLGMKRREEITEAIDNVASGKKDQNLSEALYWDNIWRDEGPNTWRTYPEAFKRVGEQILAAESVLDVGCGVGILLESLRKQSTLGLYAGMDISPEAVAQVAARGFEAKVGTLPTIPWPDDAFDVVVATEVLEHLGDPDGFLVEAKRVARRMVIVTVPDNVLGPADEKEHRRCYDRAQLREALEKHFDKPVIDGFVDVFPGPGDPGVVMPTLMATCKVKKEALCGT